MSSVSLTDRQQRERQYYDQYTQGRVVEKVDFEPIEGHEKRPWNSYWYVFQLASEAREQRPQRVLDFGCGQGERSLLLARLGYEVFGFDISQASVDSARKLAEAYHCDPMPQFSVQVAEHLDYPNEHFDLVVGVDILHHVDIPQAAAECFRLLKPHGKAIFREPIESPIFEPLRNNPLVTRLFPKGASFERHITEDERKLTRRDLATIRELSPQCDIHYFRVFSRVGVLFKKLPLPSKPMFEEVDYYVVRKFPSFGSLCAGAVVIVLPK